MAAGRGAVPGGTEVSLRALCRIQLCSDEAAEQLGAAQPLGGPRSSSERCAASSSTAMKLQSSWARRSPWGDRGLPQSALPHPALQSIWARHSTWRDRGLPQSAVPHPALQARHSVWRDSHAFIMPSSLARRVHQGVPGYPSLWQATYPAPHLALPCGYMAGVAGTRQRVLGTRGHLYSGIYSGPGTRVQTHWQ
ncbi:hypothetical protein PCANC_02634 [Puccinia coronata f. sp. avenae]|uniref:Uncharacterized protein n=1 Tax=Puccinia coronata f. sp. avenae TaxID=200324 RepID=A0A2N5W5H4_9BASI|nr:hypothetical protein PCANC_02634 [Puccinia coronata f. sp. avenae]